MIEALWSVEFVSNAQDFGAGMVVLETGRALGGDNQYSYVGTYKPDPTGVVHAEVLISHYFGPGHSIFGQSKQFTVHLSGKPEYDSFTMQGDVAGQPNMRVTVRFTRRAELPNPP